MTIYIIIRSYAAGGGGVSVTCVKADKYWKVYRYIMDVMHDGHVCKNFIKRLEKFDKDNDIDEDIAKNDLDRCVCGRSECSKGDEEAHISWIKNDKDYNYCNVFEYFCTPGEGNQYGDPGKEYWGIEVYEYKPSEIVEL